MTNTWVKSDLHMDEKRHIIDTGDQYVSISDVYERSKELYVTNMLVKRNLHVDEK